MLARVSICDFRGRVILDTYVRPTQPVTNYFNTGITPANLASGSSIDDVRSFVALQIRNKIIVGFKLYEDLKMLRLVHPALATRDIHQYWPYRDALLPLARPEDRTMNIDLPIYIFRLMGHRIAVNTHDSLENARACMDLYRSTRAWETDYEATGDWPCMIYPGEFQQYFT
ncbi:hypothetical protein DL93DRAFT_2069973 [Clavulina sp. PMI_390]|nr:hypothetical protein DL93DRAFT_2069973 [Clavulina sp. PMI_390]